MEGKTNYSRHLQAQYKCGVQPKCGVQATKCGVQNGEIEESNIWHTYNFTFKMMINS